jgi:AraC-like DNA-binding protein
VDLMGRLSNPSDATKALILHSSTKICKSTIASCENSSGPTEHESVDLTEEEGRLSNPVKRRLAEEKIVQLVKDHVSGLSVNEVARRHGIHRTTVMNHLESRGVQRRRNLRKLSSLAAVAKQFGVSETTITREFHAAGIRIRPRRGWAKRNLSR